MISYNNNFMQTFNFRIIIFGFYKNLLLREKSHVGTTTVRDFTDQFRKCGNYYFLNNWVKI
ncbi:conserved hypothetical protein [Leptospira interrogans serovar Manilae]|uniref:Uncharacterized protein n=13 Tax=Leptospira interrogans TaxID=173 RepID=A0AAQ1SMY3_LEPIR|nr:hypothetical protein LA733_3364 [Leptospira interrogans]KWV23234.1 hypothetical protein LA702_3323 [Leptospira interrogans]SOR60895.1 conserved hypothetical protein [Leptospira interrogans serovar Manilae]